MFSRIDNVLHEHCGVLLPIEGYENVQLMSLEEAVQPLVSLFDAGSLLSKVWVAKERCKNPADGLSQDESASIMLYTMEWPSPEQSLYFILNAALRMEDRDRLKPWFSYLRLFIGALSQLPAINDTIHRGVKRDMSSEYPMNSNPIWWGLSSCTDNIQLLESERFCGKTGIRTMFQIKCLDGRNIQKHSYYQNESEILLMPGRYFRVRSQYHASDGLLIVVLNEETPPHELLKLPDNSLWRRFAPGISLLGTCLNSECDAYQKEVIIPIGLRHFDVLTDADASTSKCPKCTRYVEPAKLAFYKCQWRIDGIKQTQSSQPPVPFSQDWSRTHRNSLFEYRLEEGVTWRKLRVEIRPENAS
jgi:hypothetical protein